MLCSVYLQLSPQLFKALTCNLTETLRPNPRVKHFKLDRDVEAGLDFAVITFEGKSPEIVHYAHKFVSQFTDWGGPGVNIKHTYQQPHRPYQDRFLIELTERIGGHQFEETPTLNGFFSSGGIKSGKVRCIDTDGPPNKQEPLDFCLLDCGRTCLEPPIFCGQW